MSDRGCVRVGCGPGNASCGRAGRLLRLLPRGRPGWYARASRPLTAASEAAGRVGSRRTSRCGSRSRADLDRGRVDRLRHLGLVLLALELEPLLADELEQGAPITRLLDDGGVVH